MERFGTVNPAVGDPETSSDRILAAATAVRAQGATSPYVSAWAVRKIDPRSASPSKVEGIGGRIVVDATLRAPPARIDVKRSSPQAIRDQF
jgi:hypothetical protein